MYQESKRFFQTQFQEILSLCCKTSIETCGSTVSTWREEIASDFFGIICQQAYSISKIYDGEVVGIHSSYVLLRAMYEAYVNMHFVCMVERSNEEEIFLQKALRRHGLYHRIRFVRSMRHGGKHPEQESENELQNLKNEVLTISSELEELRKKLYPDTKKLFNEKYWWFENIADRTIKNLLINQHLHDFLYSYLSDFTHSGPFSISEARPDSRKIEAAVATIAIFSGMVLHLALRDFMKFNPTFNIKHYNVGEDMQSRFDFYEKFSIQGFKALTDF